MPKSTRIDAGVRCLFQQANKQNVSGKRIFILRRVSSRHQRSALEDQHHLKAFTESLGGIVVSGYGYIKKGSDSNYHNSLFEKATAANADAILAESMDRFVRHPDFGPGKFTLKPTTKQLLTLRKKAGMIKLLTVMDPDAPPEDVRAFQSRRTKRKRTKGHERRYRLMKKAARLRKDGYSLTSISSELNVPKRTLSDWFKRA